ncbi:MAG TPA: DUF4255 domain-containing protein [Longimicrobium sp.]|nr:DUF4255 domain-containing protein [Longimicrobium sp.]
MIADLDNTLKQLLVRELPAGLVPADAITFATPHDQFQAAVKPPAVNLFLYDIRENRDLRRVDPQVERRDGVMVQTRPPVRVDCSYLVTAWATTGAGKPAGYDEHRLLSEVMRVLLRHPTLPAAVLQGSLVSQELPLPTTTLQQGHLQNLAELWQALGGRARAAFNYTVTIAMQVAEPVNLGPPVTTRTARVNVRQV